VRIDMESSVYTAATLAQVEQLHAEGYPVGAVLQAYLYRTGADLDRLLAAGIPVRLVKGAYREPPAVAWQRKRVVDDRYLGLMRRLLEAAAAACERHGPAPGHSASGVTLAAIASHDPRVLAAAVAHARRRALPPACFEFQMLYGIRRDLQRRLRDEGWRVRVYLPFGPAWYPYFMRRLAERPANILFLLKNLGH